MTILVYLFDNHKRCIQPVTVCAFFCFMGTFINLTGQRFGHFTVIKKAEKTPSISHANWLCKCDCGNEVVKSRPDRIKNNHCGCQFIANKATKVCSLCGKQKDKKEYHILTRRGVKEVQAKCKECTTEYQKGRYWSNRDEMVKKMTINRLKPKSVLQRKYYYLQNKEKYKKKIFNVHDRRRKKEKEK